MSLCFFSFPFSLFFVSSLTLTLCLSFLPLPSLSLKAFSATDINYKVVWPQHPLRPEFIESTYFLYKVSLKTNKDDLSFHPLSLSLSLSVCLSLSLCLSLCVSLSPSLLPPSLLSSLSLSLSLSQATNDPFYLEVGKIVVHNLNQYARVRCGFASIKDVKHGSKEDR